MALKKKKRLEKQLFQIDGTLSTIEFQRGALENANTNAEVLTMLPRHSIATAHQQKKCKLCAYYNIAAIAIAI